MGWTGVYVKGRLKASDMQQFIRKEFSHKEILRTEYKNGVVYMAFKHKDAVEAAVFLVKPEDGIVYYKDMHECCGPYYFDASKKLISMLTPTDDKYANEWRETCLSTQV